MLVLREGFFDDMVQEYQLEEADVWFVRFSLDPMCTTLACGNRNGTLLLWDPNELRSTPRAKLKRPASATRMAVSLLNPAVHVSSGNCMSSARSRGEIAFPVAFKVFQGPCTPLKALSKQTNA